MAEEALQPPPANERAIAARLGALASTRGYDPVIRILFICSIVLLALPNAAGLVARIRGHVWDLALLADVLARSGVLLYLALAAWLALVRMRPIGKAPGVQPRVSALVGSFLPLSIVLFPRHELSIALNMLSAGLMFLGHVLAVYALAWLGRSFSIMAEARRLVTGGAYALVRHPLYLAEEIALIGLSLQYASPSTAVLVVAHLAFQLQRMRNEERVLGDTFPEYAAYARTTQRLIPGVY
jgi:protein-S-isoprenylcysteine O-methyltransferase Ste14